MPGSSGASDTGGERTLPGGRLIGIESVGPHRGWGAAVDASDPVGELDGTGTNRADRRSH